MHGRHHFIEVDKDLPLVHEALRRLRKGNAVRHITAIHRALPILEADTDRAYPLVRGLEARALQLQVDHGYPSPPHHVVAEHGLASVRPAYYDREATDRERQQAIEPRYVDAYVPAGTRARSHCHALRDIAIVPRVPSLYETLEPVHHQLLSISRSRTKPDFVEPRVGPTNQATVRTQQALRKRNLPSPNKES